MYFQVNTVRKAYNHDKERIDLPLPLTRIEMEVPLVVKFELHPQKNSKR